MAVNSVIVVLVIAVTGTVVLSIGKSPDIFNPVSVNQSVITYIVNSSIAIRMACAKIACNIVNIIPDYINIIPINDDPDTIGLAGWCCNITDFKILNCDVAAGQIKSAPTDSIAI